MTLFISELTQNISQILIPLHLCGSLRQAADAPLLLCETLRERRYRFANASKLFPNLCVTKQQTYFTEAIAVCHSAKINIWN
ncbi:hypothetical protein [Nostoc sp. FACHB-133]|uniref:hypothetical protein n=1 Tax=Nostoc sp. FACHB-133 TaxID=2692835 RepID=UPI001687524F|nr:hypothetical protein [Nostoc sp. FACHB-133]MBD2525476.1 hypothetical protein [Nostoc sp. FACHB-133]